ncbi:hypothetical protein SAMN04487968_11444 [Nocardioides terrae]|uniref:Uncharacterized protein n=1 Tax=Nocardioides terrae TaxID=574651 RepID=A0A1I1N7I6_9ACTN|nr:hypothetical protein [Nocardioides terrae]SFC91448.1 hypothetical protein SAMN04487968_11444 [Nocardioides terrae]
MTLRKSSSTTLLERAADRTTDAVGTAVELTSEFLENTAKPFVENTARPALHDAAAKTAPMVAAGASMAAQRATQAKDYAEAKSAQLTGHPKPKRRGRKMLTFVLLGGLAAAVAVVARRFMGGGSDQWTAPAPPSTPQNPAETFDTDQPVDDLTTPISKPPYSSN